MFIDNKYKKWYDALIEKAKGRTLENGVYVEKHHIVPKAAGGGNEKSNIVKLLAREHFMCHLLLTKCTVGKLKRDMHYGVGAFMMNSPFNNRRFTSWEYKKVRESLSKSRKGVKRDPAIGRKTSRGLMGNIPWNKGLKTGPHSDESNRKRSETLKGVSDIEKYGIEGAKKRSAKLSASKMGHKAGMTNKKHSEETVAKMRISSSGVKGPQKRFALCPQCGNEEVTSRHIKFCKKKMMIGSTAIDNALEEYIVILKLLGWNGKWSESGSSPAAIKMDNNLDLDVNNVSLIDAYSKYRLLCCIDYAYTHKEKVKY